jgi:hypothetical protein
MFHQTYKFNLENRILFVLFMASIGLAIYTVNLYRITIIGKDTLFIVSTIGVLIGLLLIRVFIKNADSNFWTYLIGIIISISVSNFGLLFLNQTFSDKEIKNEIFQIEKRGTLGRGKSSKCFQPYVVIDFHGKEKEIVFYCDSSEQLKLASNLSIAYSKGLFGLEIIKSKKLL